MRQSRIFMKHDFMEQAATLALLLGISLIGYLAIGSISKRPPGAELARQTMSLPDFVPVARRFAPSFVHIATSYADTAPALSYGEIFDFSVPAIPPPRHGVGAGIIIHRDGHILTNYHVVEGANKVTVKLADRRELDATVVGRDAKSDIALIKVAAPTALNPAALGDSSILETGDWVIAMGSPFGLDRTLTVGIVSAKSRRIAASGYYDYIQTDASINPGNSGGALVNLKGELVGINTAIYSQSGGNIGIGFAIPINMASQIMEQLVKFGEVNRGFLGAEMQNLTPDLAAAFGLPSVHGAVLVNVIAGSPAEQAGLRAGDVVTSVNSKPVRDASDLRNQVGLMRVGDTLKLEILRDGKRQVMNANVGSRHTASASSGIKNERLAGVSVGDISENSPGYGQLFGVMVYEISKRSRAFAAGLRVGDIITGVNRQPVEDLNAFVEIVSRLPGQLLLRVQRGNQGAFLVIK